MIMHALAILLSAIPFAQGVSDGERAAHQVVRRTFPELAARVDFRGDSPLPGPGYAFTAAGDHLIVEGSDPVAMCRGFYDYLRHHGSIWAWSGRRLGIAGALPDAKRTTARSPYRWRLRDNVCAFGYTSPYWGWQRWEAEIDWMALHGFNMMLAPTATEAIWERVWKQFGISQQELDAFFTGPAFLPWHRMGNLNGYSGPLTPAWHAGQIALQKKILARMRELGIEPIAPAFAGFVPAGLERRRPGLKTHAMAPWAGFAPRHATRILDPLDPLFAQIGTAYLREWQREFGAARFFIADSFNELRVPVPEDRGQRLETLARYGRAVFDSIAAGSEDGVWVMMGWLFSFMPEFWDRESAAALLRDVPDERMLILDLSQEHYRGWKEQNFYGGKQWLFSYIPTWGGNNLPVGDLRMYAADPSWVLSSVGESNCVGFGVSGEGFESNEVAYELLSDTAWTSEPIDLDVWLPQYMRSRYGRSSAALEAAWRGFLGSNYRSHGKAYAAFMLRPREFAFGARISSFPADETYAAAVRCFLSEAEELSDEPLFRQDAIEFAVPLIARRGEERLGQAFTARILGREDDAKRMEGEALDAWLAVDALLEQHPLYRLQLWIDHARQWGRSDAERNRYEVDARRIVTTWGGALTEYAARAWSGLVRDYYVPRWRAWLEHRGERAFRITDWEEAWITSSGLSEPRELADPIAEIRKWLARGRAWRREETPIVPQPASVKMHSGSIAITPASRIAFAEPALEGAARLLADDVERVFGCKLAVVAGARARSGDILLRRSGGAGLGGEGYRIRVTDRVVIEASGLDGLLAGGVSLLQALSSRGRDLMVPRMAIADEPARSLRALMIDVKNHWHSVEQLKHFVDLCRYYKVRYLSLHTGETQWIGSVMRSTAAIPAPERARRRLYTRGEIDGLIAYARARGVHLFPHNETTEGFATMRAALQTDFLPSDAYPNWIQEAYAEERVEFRPGNSEGLDGKVRRAGNGVDATDPDYWKALGIFTRRSYRQYAAGYADGKLPYYHMGPVQGEGGTHPNNAVRVLEILRSVDADVKLLLWNGPNARSGHDLIGHEDETIICFYSKAFSASDIGAYLDSGWPVLNCAWSPLYIVGEGVARTQRQVYEDWNLFRTGTDGFTGTFQYGAIEWEEFDTPAQRRLVRGGMLCTWEVPSWIHLDRLRTRLPAFAEHAWHHRPWPYPASDYDDFRTRFLAADARVQAFLGLAPRMPSAPRGLKASDGEVVRAIRVSWQGSAGFPDGYRLLRSRTNRLEDAAQVSGDLGEERYLDAAVELNVPYYYWVKAFNATGEGPASGPVQGSAGDGIARSRIYEPFEYPAGSDIDGESGGEGWAGGWSVRHRNGVAQVVAGGLRYGSLPVRGGALRVHPSRDGPGFALEREMAEKMGLGDTTLWLSFLVRAERVGAGHVFVIPNRAGAAAVGKRWGTRFAFDNDSSSVDMTSAGTGFRVEVQGYGQGEYRLDELRMGATWAFVTGAAN